MKTKYLKGYEVVINNNAFLYTYAENQINLVTMILETMNDVRTLYIREV